MYFKRLEIFGFKSFAEKTVLDFQPGITAVVGPNGCGKSNVFDSIRWVLGEQSVKDLRGSSMEDVIFSGTDKKLPLGFAEVSVTFSNESRVLPIEYDEVIVTRRLFRSGESEYLLNKNTCRLKDIVELFLGTGVGAEAYSLIQQGKVDLVVSAKPDDRRQIFDEAAGITKYKSKKKEALSKLKEAEENLLRVNDIVVEVKRQISTIERQAKKAQRYKEEFEQLKSFELIMAQYHLGKFNADLSALTEMGRMLQDKEVELCAQLKELNERQANETALVEELDEEINVLKSKHMRLENDIEINGRQMTFNDERLSNIDSTCARLEADKSAALERCKTNQGKIEEIKSALTGITEHASVLKVQLQQKRDEQTILMHAIDEAVQSIKTYDEEQRVLHSQEVRVKNQLTDLMKRHMEYSTRRSRLEQENVKIHGEKTQVSQKFESIRQAIDLTTTQMQVAWEELAVKRQALEESQLELANQENAIDELEKSRVFLASQKEFIAKMQVQYQDSPDPIVEGRFICPVRPSEKHTGIIGKIKTITEIPASEMGQVIYEIIYETKYIELDLEYMDERITQVDAEISAGIDLTTELGRMVRVRQEDVDGGLKNIQELEKKLSVLESQKGDIELETGKITGELDLINAESVELENNIAGIKVQEDELNITLSGVSDQVIRCQEDIRVKQSAIAAKHQEREDFNVTIVQLEGEFQSIADKQRSFEESIKVYTQNLDRDLSDVSRFDEEVQAAQAKKAALYEDTARLTALIDELKASIMQIASQLNDLTAQKSEMTARLSSLRQQVRAIEEAIINIKTERHNQDMRQQEIHFNQRSLKERLMQAYRIDMDNLPAPAQPEALPAPAAEGQGEGQGTSEGVPAEGAVIDGALENVNDPAAIGAAVSQAIAQSSDANAVVEVPAEPQPEINVDELTLEIEKLKKRCEGYGAVNLVAIEEFEELKTRFEFLTKQQSDLLTARESLMQTIQKINRTTRVMFSETFIKVNEEFQTYFKMLFGGGEAQLILLDPENPLECGIDIVARPPGKKPQNISLLSGGEKTLTAIALIFGVFKVNPSPFCVLDEIDAALDESNVARFARLLKEFAKIAQFIVITHNKKTMESCDVLYGVTMPERGISRIVSVNFNQKNTATPAEIPAPAAEQTATTPEVDVAAEPVTQPTPEASTSQPEAVAA